MPVNLILLAIALTVGIVLVVFVWKASRALEHDELNAEAFSAQEHERLMPSAPPILEEDEDDSDGARSPRGGYGTVSRV